MPQAPTTEEATKNAERRGGSGGGTGTSGRGGDVPIGRVAAPSTRYTQYNEGGIFRVSVPSNWRELQDNDNVTFSPDGGYGTVSGQSVFTHGIQIGMTRNETHNLQTATDELIDSISRGIPTCGVPAPTSASP